MVVAVTVLTYVIVQKKVFHGIIERLEHTEQLPVRYIISVLKQMAVHSITLLELL